MKILGSFFFLYKNLCCGYSLKVPQLGASNGVSTLYFFMENWRKLSQNYHQILLLNNTSDIASVTSLKPAIGI